MTRDLIKYLPWDTAHFGLRVARSQINSVDAESALRLLDACREEAIDCLYFLADSSDQATINELQRHDFDFVDIRVTLDKSLRSPVAAPTPEGVNVRLHRDDDIAPLLALSRGVIQVSRFFSDRRFDKSKVADMYRIWVEKSLRSDFADGVVVAELGGRPAAFETLHLNRPPGQGNIGLALVTEHARGKGLGGILDGYALNWFRDQGMHTVNVVTQGQNVAAQRMYQKAGFRARRMQLWFHKWFNGS